MSGDPFAQKRAHPLGRRERQHGRGRALTGKRQGIDLDRSAQQVQTMHLVQAPIDPAERTAEDARRRDAENRRLPDHRAAAADHQRRTQQQILAIARLARELEVRRTIGEAEDLRAITGVARQEEHAAVPGLFREPDEQTTIEQLTLGAVVVGEPGGRTDQDERRCLRGGTIALGVEVDLLLNPGYDTSRDPGTPRAASTSGETASGKWTSRQRSPKRRSATYS